MLPARLLIADDEKNVRLTLSQALEDLGLITESVHTGDAALRQLRKRAYDLLILDLKTSGLSGIETLRRLRVDHPELPVVMLTAYGSIEVAVEATRLGAADFLQKPVSLERLRTCISRVLKRPALEAKAASSYDEWIELAKRHVQRQQFTDARRCLSAAVDTDAARPEAHTLLGLVHVLNNQVAAARRHYRRALEVAPDAPTARIHLDQLGTGERPLFLDNVLPDDLECSLRLPSNASSKAKGQAEVRHRVLVGVKEGPEAGRTRSNRLLVQVAAAAASAHGKGELLLLQVLEAPRQLSPSQAAAAHHEMMQRMQEQLQRLGRSATRSELALQTLVVAGHDTASVIQNTVEAMNVSHVVLGWSEDRAHASTTLRRVTRNVDCALTLVRPGSFSSDVSPTLRRIVALVSDDPHTPCAVRRAKELAQQAGIATLTLLNVQPRGAASVETLQHRGQHIVWNAAERAGLEEGQCAIRVLLARDMVHTLLEAAASYDAVYVGASRNTALAEALFGSVPGRLLATTDGTVVVARGPQHVSRSVIDALGNRLSGG